MKILKKILLVLVFTFSCVATFVSCGKPDYSKASIEISVVTSDGDRVENGGLVSKGEKTIKLTAEIKNAPKNMDKTLEVEIVNHPKDVVTLSSKVANKQGELSAEYKINSDGKVSLKVYSKEKSSIQSVYSFDVVTLVNSMQFKSDVVFIERGTIVDLSQVGIGPSNWINSNISFSEYTYINLGLSASGSTDSSINAINEALKNSNKLIIPADSTIQNFTLEVIAKDAKGESIKIDGEELKTTAQVCVIDKLNTNLVVPISVRNSKFGYVYELLNNGLRLANANSSIDFVKIGNQIDYRTAGVMFCVQSNNGTIDIDGIKYANVFDLTAGRYIGTDNTAVDVKYSVEAIRSINNIFAEYFTDQNGLKNVFIISNDSNLTTENIKFKFAYSDKNNSAGLGSLEEQQVSLKVSVEEYPTGVNVYSENDLINPIMSDQEIVVYKQYFNNVIGTPLVVKMMSELGELEKSPFKVSVGTKSDGKFTPTDKNEFNVFLYNSSVNYNNSSLEISGGETIKLALGDLLKNTDQAVERVLRITSVLYPETYFDIKLVVIPTELKFITTIDTQFVEHDTILTYDFNATWLNEGFSIDKKYFNENSFKSFGDLKYQLNDSNEVIERVEMIKVNNYFKGLTVKTKVNTTGKATITIALTNGSKLVLNVECYIPIEGISTGFIKVGENEKHVNVFREVGELESFTALVGDSALLTLNYDDVEFKNTNISNTLRYTIESSDTKAVEITSGNILKVVGVSKKVEITVTVFGKDKPTDPKSPPANGSCKFKFIVNVYVPNK